MPHTVTTPFSHCRGPRTSPKIALVGEAWGETEAQTGLPFMGSSGQELTRMLGEAGISVSSCFMTNTFNLRPANNDIETLCGPKGAVGAGYNLLPIRQGKYILPEYLGELARLKSELTAARPNLAIALGGTAAWALIGSAKITAQRGTITESCLVPGLKVLPTFHPSAILRNWANRPIVVADLLKAAREQEYPEIRRPQRQVLINPTLDEVIDITEQIIGGDPGLLAVDIETAHRQITMIGFAWGVDRAAVIPFALKHPFRSYWPDHESEVKAWRCVKAIVESQVPKLFQNGLYDIQYIARMGFAVNNCAHDTMLLHHALYPELPKSLGFLGSIYTNEAAWKLMRHNTETTKRDE